MAKNRPSALLLFAGLIALAVSAWAMAGPATWGAVAGDHVGWVVVLAAIAVGAVLVLSPSRKR